MGNTSLKLYKITFTHYGPKSSEEGFKGFVLAEDDASVFNHVDLEFTGGSWSDRIWGETDSNGVTEYRPEEYPDGPTGKDIYDQILKERGDYWDEPWGDLYYGITQWGWDEGQDINAWDADSLVRLGVATRIKTWSPEEIASGDA